jgi:hypothetical protein
MSVHTLVVCAAYGTVAWWCHLSANLARTAPQPDPAWRWATWLLLTLGLNVLLQGDVLFVLLMRSIAKSQGWYEHRRTLQYLVIGLGSVAAIFVLRAWMHGTDTKSYLNRPAWWGIGALLGLEFLRIVSAHHTDAVLNLRIAGLSMGRLTELAALVAIVIGARLQQRLLQAKQ